MKVEIEKLKKKYSRDSWIDPRLELKRSPVEGMGVFAKESIKEGETVNVWGGTIMTREDIKAGKAAKHTIAAIGEGIYLADKVGKPPSLDDYMNHSCDPNVWMEDEVTLVARRDIKAGEELTADYAMWITDPTWRMGCACGSTLCRGAATGNDWKRKDLQERYKGHFSPFINKRIERLRK